MEGGFGRFPLDQEYSVSKASQEAYRKIRAGILSGHFPAGQFVPEDEFAQFCGLSRTPVREAIAELVA
ncbi:MAG: GntR family transcriptional regulator, partial [Novosphingobium sp.]